LQLIDVPIPTRSRMARSSCARRSLENVPLNRY
jgi:hypothetical protein